MIGVLYSGSSLRTCILELICAWAAADELAVVRANIPNPTDADEERDAQRDREIAAASRHVPPRLYERVYLQFVANPLVELCSLLDVATRTKLASDLIIAHKLKCYGYTDLDKGAILSPHRSLTQAVSHAVIRGVVSGGGIFSESRHEGYVYNFFFGGRFKPQLRSLEGERIPDRLTPAHEEVVSAAKDLQLVP